MISASEAGVGTIVITGAAGFLGRHLVGYFRQREWNVRALVRNPSLSPFAEPGIEVFQAELPDAIDARAFEAADVVVHGAYATAETRPDLARCVNEVGTARILAASRAAGVRRFIFISSLAARRDARSYYGRSKLALEQQLDPSHDLVIRPGLVLARRGGLFERLRHSVELSPIVPLFGGGGQILQTVHVDDLCQAFERALSRHLTGTLSVAEVEGITMREFLEQIAVRRQRKVVMVPLPSEPALRILRLFERIRIPLPVTSENLLGLITMQRVQTEHDLARLGLQIRSARQSLAELL